MCLTCVFVLYECVFRNSISPVNHEVNTAIQLHAHVQKKKKHIGESITKKKDIPKQ